MNKDNKYYVDASLNSDTCWQNAKEHNNGLIEKYALYDNYSDKEKKQSGSFPAVSAEHINLRGRAGVGVSDDYLIDVYSSLRNDEGAMTRDRCPIQLYTRIFTAGPRLKGQSGDIDRELDFLSGSDTRTIPAIGGGVAGPPLCSNKTIMEKQTYKFAPLLDYMKEVQNPDNIIPNWQWGGESSRAYLSKLKYAKGRDI